MHALPSLPRRLFVLGAGTPTLEDLDQHTGLVVGVGRECFGLLGRDGGVALVERGHGTTSGLNAERKGNNIEEVLDLLGGVTLEGGGLGDVTRVGQLIGLLAIEEIGDELDDPGDTSGTTTRMISWTWFLLALASTVPQKRSWQSTSKRAR